MTRLRTFLTGLILVAVVAACSGGGAAASATAPSEADATITAKGSAFDPAALDLSAGKPVKLFFKNLDGVPHNVAIYTDSSASNKVFVGETVTNTAILYDIPALQAGSLYFRCDVHPDMHGTLTVKG